MVAAATARNRQSRVGGFSPTQLALEGCGDFFSLRPAREGLLPFRPQPVLELAEARRRNEQLRQAAEQAYLWADGRETLRKALRQVSTPHMEFLHEGAAVYFYDPPGSRKGLPRRLQDQISWNGPGIVAALGPVKCMPRSWKKPPRR